MTNMSCIKKYVWAPWRLLTSPIQYKNRYAIMVLNRPLRFDCDPNVIGDLWNNAAFRVTVDGGTDKWLNYATATCIDVCEPDLITGDMDSILEETLKLYEAKHKAVFTPDQNETDFTKALRESQLYCSQRNLQLDTLIVIQDISGRFDQLMSNIHTLHKAKNILTTITSIYLLSCDSLTWLLGDGQHILEVPLKIRVNCEPCGLLPIGKSCQVTTSGLKWNLNKTVLEFGNCVSTSNTYNTCDRSVVITVDNAIVWTMTIKSLLS